MEAWMLGGVRRERDEKGGVGKLDDLWVGGC